MNPNTSSSGWVIDPRKLKQDDRLYLATLALSGDKVRQAFIDECLELYRTAWGIDIVNYRASLDQTERNNK